MKLGYFRSGNFYHFLRAIGIAGESSPVSFSLLIWRTGHRTGAFLVIISNIPDFSKRRTLYLPHNCLISDVFTQPVSVPFQYLSPA